VKRKRQQTPAATAAEPAATAGSAFAARRAANRDRAFIVVKCALGGKLCHALCRSSRHACVLMLLFPLRLMFKLRSPATRGTCVLMLLLLPRLNVRAQIACNERKLASPSAPPIEGHVAAPPGKRNVGHS
jgi:hypothetical protein